jgi:undecaprenyl-diphosphatase
MIGGPAQPAIRWAVLPHLLALDHALRGWVVGHRIGALDDVMWGLSAAGRGGMVWIAIGAGLVTWRKLRASALIPLLLALLLASVAADHILKPLVLRERPFASTPRVKVIGERPHDSSFPSGHTSNAFAGAYVLSLVAAEPAALWWLLAAAIAYSRVYLGVHYPLDVIAGAIVGLGCGALAVSVHLDRWVDRVNERRRRARSPS